MLFITLLVTTSIKYIMSIEIKPGEPVPHADVLEQLLTSNNVVNTSDLNDGSVFDFIFGDDNNGSEKLNTDNVDISILDADNVHKIVEMAKAKYNANYRRQYPAGWQVEHEAYRSNPFFVSKAFDMMKQSIYATRYRLEKTRPFRQKFQHDMDYQIAVLYGSLTQLIYKMDNMYAQMNNFGLRTHFIWYLILYEKILAAHVDATYITQKIFKTQSNLMEMLAPSRGGQHMITPPPGNLQG